MSAHLPQLHAPRWLRDRLHVGHHGRHRMSGQPLRAGRAHGGPVLPVAIVVALSLCAGIAQVVGLAAGAPVAALSVPAGLEATGGRMVSVPGPDGGDAQAASLMDVPPASVDAVSL